MRSRFFLIRYELAIHNAVQTEWPEAELKGCIFHLVQNMNKHLATANLFSRYNTNTKFTLHVRMLLSAAFLQEEDVIRSLTELEDTLPQEPALLISWFTYIYVGWLRENGGTCAAGFSSSGMGCS